MSDVYTPNPANNPSAYTMPDDGDEIDAASIRPALEGLADKTAHLSGAADVGTGVYPLASRQIEKVARSVAGFDNFRLVQLGVGVGGGIWLQSSVASSSYFIAFELDPPNNTTVDRVRVYVQGSSGHVALPGSPGNPAFVEIHAVDVVTGTSSTVGTLVIDSSPDVASYESVHFIEVSFTPQACDRSKRLVAYLVGESGANSLPNLRVFGCFFRFTTTAQDDGAS